MKRLYNIVFFIGFMLCLWLPPAAYVANLQPAPLLHLPDEKAPWPVFPGTFADMGGYAKALQLYYQTHFGLRDWLASVDIYTRNFLLDSHTLSLTLPENPPPLCNYSDVYKNSFPQEALQIASNQAQLARQHIAYAVMIIPTKDEIEQSFTCGEDFMRNAYADTLHRLAPDVWIINIFNDVRLSQAQHPSFYITDDHWNNTGAFAGYRALVRSLSQRFPMTPELKASDFILEKKTFPALPTLANITQKLPFTETDVFYTLKPSHRAHRTDANKDLALPMWQYNYEDEVYVSPGARPHAVIFQTSMFEPLKPWLAEHFSRTCYHWDNAIDWDIIAREKPDIVIQQLIR